MSAHLGTAFHEAMEAWYKFKDIGYGVSKNPFLAHPVNSFPRRDDHVLPELMVSDLTRGLVGQIDGLLMEAPKTGFPLDYKSDADVKKHLVRHFNQLSFYSHILIAHGWTISHVEVWNYTGEWTKYDSPVLPLRLKFGEDK